MFAGTATCAQAYLGAISRSPEQRSSRVATMNAVSAVGYICGPGIGGALLVVGTMVRIHASRMFHHWKICSW